MSQHRQDTGYLWAIGGKIKEAHTLPDTTVYSVADDRWYSSVTGDLEPMPQAVSAAGWTLHDGQIYCFGGKTIATQATSRYTDAVQVYDIEHDEWRQKDPMPAARSKLGKFYPVVADRYVYLFGGDTSEGPNHRVAWNWQYDLKQDTWNTDVTDAPFPQSFPCPSLHDGWVYYATGNTQRQAGQNDYPGALTQRYHPETDRWQVVSPCPHPVTDGSGAKWNNELHFLGGWNTNRDFYHDGAEHYVGPVKRQHVIYNYQRNSWRYASALPGHWHHGGCRATANYLWRYLGVIDEEMADEGADQHTDRIFRWDGDTWEERSPAPVKKNNFGTVKSLTEPAC